jgi:hypothetical protein
VEGLNLILETIKLGIRCGDVEQVWRKHIAKAGLEKEKINPRNTQLINPKTEIKI